METLKTVPAPVRHCPAAEPGLRPEIRMCRALLGDAPGLPIAVPGAGRGGKSMCAAGPGHAPVLAHLLPHCPVCSRPRWDVVQVQGTRARVGWGCGGVSGGHWKSPPVSGAHCHWLVLGRLAWQGLRELGLFSPSAAGALQNPPPTTSGHPQGVSPIVALIWAEASLLCVPDPRIPAVHLGLWGRQQLRTHLVHPERS